MVVDVKCIIMLFTTAVKVTKERYEMLFLVCLAIVYSTSNVSTLSSSKNYTLMHLYGYILALADCMMFK